MATTLKRFFKHPLTPVLITWTLPVVTATYLYITGWLFLYVTLYVWQVVVLASLPLVAMGGLSYIRQRAGRRFKTGDKVQVVGDSRCFVVLDYSFWQPNRARLIEQNNTLFISIKDLYLSPFQKPDPEQSISNALRSITQGNIPPAASQLRRL